MMIMRRRRLLPQSMQLVMRMTGTGHHQHVIGIPIVMVIMMVVWGKFVRMVIMHFVSRESFRHFYFHLAKFVRAPLWTSHRG